MRAAQFGLTLFTYEVVQRLLYVDFGGSRFFFCKNGLAFTLCGTDNFNSTTQAKWFTEGDNQRGCKSSAIKVN